MFRKAGLYSAFLILALILAGCRSEDSSRSQELDPDQDSALLPAAHDSLIIEMEGVDSLSVFDVLKAQHQVDYFSTAAGVFVRAIDSIGGDSRTFWVYSVNDSVAQVACDRYITRSGDRIRWHFRRLER